MRAAVYQAGPNGSNSLQVVERAVPPIRRRDVLVEVAAAGVTVADILLRKDIYPGTNGEPGIPGLEVSGVVVEVGSEVTEWRIGDSVCAIVTGGGYAEQVAVPADHCLPVPVHWSMNDAASAVGPICTAWFNVAMLGRLSPAESVLVHGGGGGVGSWAVQIFAGLGHHTFATAGGAQRCERVESLGATRCFDHRTEAFDTELLATTETQGVDVVLDILGAGTLEKNLRVLKDGGRLVGIATQQGALAQLDLWSLYRRRLSLLGSTLRSQSDQIKRDIVASVHLNVWPLILRCRMPAVVDSVFPLEQAIAAQNRLEEGTTFGKVVLQIKESIRQ